MAETRIYLIDDSQTGNQRLVDATNPAQAIRHVSLSRFIAKPASPKDVARLLGDEEPTA